METSSDYHTLLSESFLEARTHAKVLFRQGKIQESFEFIKTNVRGLADEHLKEEETARAEVLSALILEARLRQEIGEFPRADVLLDEAWGMLADTKQGTFYYTCKYFHIKSKNLVRATYQQRALEKLREGIQFIQAHNGDERLKAKYECKLKEALGHLMCEPLLFEKCEQELEEAEEIYKKNKGTIFSELDIVKFNIKKSSFLKKWGFFFESLDLLEKILKTLTELLKSPKNAKEGYLSKKLLFKVYRDQARLYALLRQETKAHEAHRKAEKLFKEELIPLGKGKQALNQSVRSDTTIKQAKLQLLKGLWISKFGWDKSIDELVEAYHMFAEATGDEKNYFGANSQLEIASNQCRLKDYGTAGAFLTQAVNIFEHLFGEKHPLIAKYYSYSADLYSYTEDNVGMLEMARKTLEVSEFHNKPADANAPPSLFIMDPLLQLISYLSQGGQTPDEERNQEFSDCVDRLERIYGENGIVDGGQLLQSAMTMKSMTLIREEKIHDALDLLEDTYQKQLKRLRNCTTHPFLEQCINQLALLYKVTRNNEKAEELYQQLVNIKSIYYGELSETLLISLKNLGTIQIIAEKADQGYETLNRAIVMAEKIIEAKKVKDMNVFKDHVQTCVFLNLQLLDKLQKPFDNEYYNRIEDLLLAVYGGEKTAQFAQFLFIKSKKMMVSPNSIPEHTLASVSRAIEIQEDLEKNSTKKSAQLGRYYYFQATVFEGLDRWVEAVESLKKASAILGNYEDYAELKKEIDKHIQKVAVTGGISIPAGSTEDPESKVEADEENNTGTLIAVAAVGAIAVGAIIYAATKLLKKA